jgi:para-nitrobenzyl esterase
VSVVETSSGRVAGVREGRVHAFRGIPYGRAERFRPPTPPEPWVGTRDATAFGPSSPPTLTEADRAHFGRSALWRDYAGVAPSIPFSKDCLRLNVWTPALDDARRPVLVWLHGGGWIWGSGSSSWTEGDRLAGRRDAVVVTLNHRLGVLGYLDLEDALGDEWVGAGVAGLLDLQLALEWVRDNVASFGGDPGSVTIAGHSGGGAKVAALLALPGARGLFHRAIVQSGVVGLGSVDRDEGEETAARLLEAAGGVDGLLRLSADELTRLAAPHRFRAVARTSLFPAHPFEPVAAESAAGIPLLIGTAAEDSAAFKFDSDPRFGRLEEPELRELAARHPATELGALADEAIALCRTRHPDATPSELLALLATQRLRERTLRLAERKLAGSDATVHVYLFAYRTALTETPVFAGRPIAWHGLELPFAFDVADRVPYTGDDPARLELARAMSGAWIAFARGASPGWPAWDPERRATMVFDRRPGVVLDPQPEDRPLFQRLREEAWTTSGSR